MDSFVGCPCRLQALGPLSSLGSCLISVLFFCSPPPPSKSSVCCAGFCVAILKRMQPVVCLVKIFLISVHFFCSAAKNDPLPSSTNPRWKNLKSPSTSSQAEVERGARAAHGEELGDATWSGGAVSDQKKAHSSPSCAGVISNPFRVVCSIFLKIFNV